MAEAFIGVLVELKLKPPQSWRLQATVTNVKDHRLELKDVVLLDSGARLKHASFLGSQIEDIEVAADPSTFLKHEVAQSLPPPQPQAHVDPAILSFNKPEARRTPPAVTFAAPTPPVTTQLPLRSYSQAATVQPQEVREPIDDDSKTVQGEDDISRLELDNLANGASRKKRYARGRNRGRNARQNINESSPEFGQASVHNTQPGSAGWRRTPLLEEISPSKRTSTARHQTPLVSNKVGAQAGIANRRQTKKDRALEIEAQRNGWATEDATDVQEMGDFDFEANLSKFDKKAVWTQLREEDTTADEDRLVSFNRIDRKLRPNENVLERSRTSSKDAAFFEEDEDYDLGAHVVRNQSRQSLRGQPLRRESSRIGDGTGRSVSQSKYPYDIRTNLSPSVRDAQSPVSHRRPFLRFTNTEKICPTVMPDTISAIEAFAFSEPLHLSADVFTENAGRCIAEVALSAINPGNRRLGGGNINSRPVMVILASDNEAGSRAIAAAVHLRERGVRCIASVLGLAAGQDVDALDPSSFSSSLGYQLRRFDGKVMPWAQTAAFLKTLDAPPELIIDGLLDIHTRPSTLADTAPDDLREVLEMIAWANKSKAGCLAVDLPSGVDAATGTVEVIEGEPAELRAKIVVACGIPTAGLLKAMAARSNDGLGEEWRVVVADIGLNPALRRFASSDTNRRGVRLNVAFGSSWLAPIRYDSGDGPAPHEPV